MAEELTVADIEEEIRNRINSARDRLEIELGIERTNTIRHGIFELRELLDWIEKKRGECRWD